MVKIELDSKTADCLLDILNVTEDDIHNRKSALKGLTVAETYERLRACETIREKLGGIAPVRVKIDTSAG